MVKLYGSAWSTSSRCLWALNEIGLEFENIEISLKDRENKSEDYLKLNPNGKVPTLVDGEFVLWESSAINQYLAEKYKPELLGKNLEDKSLINQWSVWALIHLSSQFSELFYGQRNNLPEEALDKFRLAAALYLQILDDYLVDKDYILPSGFSIADINVGSIIIFGQLVKVNLMPYQNIARWVGQLTQRPAFIKSNPS